MADEARSRFGGSKIRTGCNTCKQRHLKCDEERPFCRRCIKSGRICDGYSRSTTPARSLKIIQYIPAPTMTLDSNPSLDLREKRAFDYFHKKATLELSGCFSTAWWSHCFLHLAKHETAIKHAVVALSTVHEQFTVAESQAFDLSEYIMQQYGKAINEVVKLNIEGNPEAVDVALTSCVLFASIESVRGHYQSSLSHIISGTKILRSQPPESPGNGDLCIPRKFLISIFRRLETQIIEVGDPGPDQQNNPSHERSQTAPDFLNTSTEALLSLETIDNRLLRFLDNIDVPATTDGLSEIRILQFAAEKQALKALYSQWQKAFEDMLRQEEHANLKNTPAGLTLLMVSSSSHILLNIDIFNIEADFDHFHNEFERILRWAEQYIELSSPSRISSSSTTTITKTPVFTMCTGCIKTLVFTVSRCRDPVLRRRGLHLLQTCNRREGIWDSNLSARVVARMIQIEENAALSYHRQNMQDIDEITSADQIPMHARVVKMQPRFGPDRQGTIQYVMMTPRIVQTEQGIQELVMEPWHYTETLTW